MGGTLIFNMVKNRFAGVFYIGKTFFKNFLLKNFQIFLHHRGPISEGDEADFPKIGPKSDIISKISHHLQKSNLDDEEISEKFPKEIFLKKILPM